MAKRLNVIKVAKLPAKKLTKKDAMQLLATLCYYYPQYTLAAARRLPYRDVRLLIRVAQKHEASRFYNLVQIAAAPHTKKGEGVKKLAEQFKDMMKNG